MSLFQISELKKYIKQQGSDAVWIFRRIYVTTLINRGGSYKIERFLNGLPKGSIWPKSILELKDG